MFGPMLVDPEGIFININRILQEMREFPEAADVATSEGGSTEATRQFRSEVREAAQAMAFATSKIVTQLNEAHETIRQVVVQLAENDASLADEVKTVLALLDSATGQSEESQKSAYT